MANKAVILQKNKGQLIDLATYEKAVAGCNTMGVALSMPGDGERELVYQYRAPVDGVFDTENFKLFQEEFKDETVLIYLANAPENMNQEDIQPFVCIDYDGKGMLVAFLVGEFNNFAQPESNRAPEYHVKERGLIPLFEKYMTDDKDPSVDGLMAYVDSPAARKEILGFSTGKFCLKLLAASGEIKTFTSSTVQSKDVNFTWSKSAWGEMYSIEPVPVKKEEPKEEPKAQNRFQAFFNKKKAEETKTEDKKTEVVTKVGDTTIIQKVDDPPKADTAIPDDSPLPDGKKWARPKASMSEKEMKKWYSRVFGGNLPKGWKERPYVVVAMSQVNEKFTEFKGETAISAALEKAKASVPEVPQKKDVEAKHVKPDNAPLATDMPIIPPKMLEDFKSIFLNNKDIKALMEGVQGIPTIEQIKLFESKHPSFFEKTGVHLSQTTQWPHHKRVDLCVNYPHLAAVLLTGITNEMCKLLGSKTTSDNKTETEVVELPKKRVFNLRKAG